MGPFTSLYDAPGFSFHLRPTASGFFFLRRERYDLFHWLMLMILRTVFFEEVLFPRSPKFVIGMTNFRLPFTRAPNSFHRATPTTTVLDPSLYRF